MKAAVLTLVVLNVQDAVIIKGPVIWCCGFLLQTQIQSGGWTIIITLVCVDYLYLEMQKKKKKRIE